MADNWLRKTHKDIQENFDPNVVPLKNMRKIIVAPGVLDGLLGEDGDD